MTNESLIDKHPRLTVASTFTVISGSLFFGLLLILGTTSGEFTETQAFIANLLSDTYGVILTAATIYMVLAMGSEGSK